MNRRNILIALGAVVFGGATIGTGAFSSTQASRSVSVTVANDNPGAYLALDETNDNQQDSEDRGEFINLENGGAASIQSGELIIDINGFFGTNGTGPATNATTDLDGVFEIINQGTQTLFVNVGDGDGNPLSLDNGDTAVSFYPGESSSTDLSSNSAQVELPVGESVPIGLRVETADGTDLDSRSNTDATVSATSTSSDSTIIDNDATPANGGYNDPEPEPQP